MAISMETNSLLFVPARDEKLRKIGKVNANAYIIDLEDSIGGGEKEEALNRTVAFLKNYKWDQGKIYVRVNKGGYQQEINLLHSFPVGFVLPKIKNTGDYADYEKVLSGKETIALIESPAALMNAKEIAALPWISALAFGAEDFTTEAGMLNTYENLFVFKSLIVLAAKAEGKKVYDTPCFQLQGVDTLEKELRQAVNLGFDGKLAIHPKQVEMINRVFHDRDADHLRHIISLYEASGETVCNIDGHVYEKLHIDKMKEQIATDP